MEELTILATFARELPCFERGMVWYQLADIFEAKGQIESADKAYVSALDCEWNDIYAIGYGTFLWRVGQNDKAVTFLRRFKERIAVGDVPAPCEPLSLDSIIAAIERWVQFASYFVEHPPK